MSGNTGAVYFNEFDRYPAAWLRNLYPSATVDDRSIADVGPNDVTGTRAHFFAGIGGWEYALALAGWPADRPVWTGSCPCQPFSAAGRGLGADDPRHLWPEFYRLIAESRPATVFGEQTAGAAGRAWLSAVRADLEAIGYAVGAADLCAAGVGAPHIRQRLYWVADAMHAERRPVDIDRQDGRDWADDGRTEAYSEPGARGQVRGVADRHGEHDDRGRDERARWGDEPAISGESVGLGNPDGTGREARDAIASRGGTRAGQLAGTGAWDNAEWLPCADGRTRCVEPGVRPLAHGVPARASKLRAYGNAIVPQLAAEFIAAFLDCEATR